MILFCKVCWILVLPLLLELLTAVLSSEILLSWREDGEEATSFWVDFTESEESEDWFLGVAGKRGFINFTEKVVNWEEGAFFKNDCFRFDVEVDFVLCLLDFGAFDELGDAEVSGIDLTETITASSLSLFSSSSWDEFWEEESKEIGFSDFVPEGDDDLEGEVGFEGLDLDLDFGDDFLFGLLIDVCCAEEGEDLDEVLIAFAVGEFKEVKWDDDDDDDEFCLSLSTDIEFGEFDFIMFVRESDEHFLFKGVARSWGCIMIWEDGVIWATFVMGEF